ncbi:hypothetical protein DMB66_57420 [Actinoplanes sp. ATCC 53533]|nr:hypothetical protein DMB66_57420 [Actinoplanes sp. ATCC 53533]
MNPKQLAGPRPDPRAAMVRAAPRLSAAALAATMAGLSGTGDVPGVSAPVVAGLWLAEPSRLEPPSEHYQGRFPMGANSDALVDRARAADAEVVDAKVGSYGHRHEFDGVYTLTVVDPEGHRWPFEPGVALLG